MSLECKEEYSSELLQARVECVRMFVPAQIPLKKIAGGYLYIIINGTTAHDIQLIFNPCY